MLHEFLREIIHPDSFKTKLTVQAKDELAAQDRVYFIHSPVFYSMYALYAGSKAIDRIEFYKYMGFYLYYEKFFCTHGNEFYYYVKFNERSEFYKMNQQMIDMLVLGADPTTLTDYLGSYDVNNYNNFLKEE